MSNIVDKYIADAESKLVPLLLEAKQNAVLFERVQLWVGRMCQGKEISEYIRDTAIPVKERVIVANSLVDILLTQAFDRLPVLDPVQNSNAPAPTSSSAPQADADDDASPAPDEIRAMIRAEVRRELANIFDIAAKVLRET